ncbi:MAG: methyltransferase domain-containing protein [Desulfuromonadales bacterium]|nr:methyltransferase domain-containing protein [Desulfuromonadales bacterium]
MTPAELLKLSGGYWSSCALHSGVRLDLFSHLTDEPTSAADIARLTSCDQRGMTMLLDALAALELVLKGTNGYSATPLSAEFLSKKSERYLGYIIQHHQHLMTGWNRLDQAVKNGTPVGISSSHTDDETIRECFLMGMFNMASQAAPVVVPSIDLGGRRRLLDLGGGPGTYAIHFCRHNPELQAVIYDLPTTRTFAERTVESFGLSHRITVVSGDITSDPIGKDFDVVWISQLLHSEGPQSAAAILKKAAQALVPGGMIVVQEFILDNMRTAPPFPALFSLNMLINTTHGQSYSQGELEEMLANAGVTDIKRLDVELPSGAGIMMGTVA